MAGQSIKDMMGYPEPFKTANPDLPTPADVPDASQPKLKLSDTQALPANEENLAHNQAVQRRNQEESDRLWNYNRRASMEAVGQQHYTDPFGNIQPVLDQQTGKPLFKEQDYVDYDQNGKPFRRQVDKFGMQTISDPDANAPVGVPKEDPFNVYKQNKYQPWERVGSNDPDKDAPVGGAPNDPGVVYKQNKNQPWSYVGNAYDISNQKGWDQPTADAAKSLTDNGRNAVGTAANEGIGKLKAQGELDVETAKQREQQLQDSIGNLSKQQESITSNPAYSQTTGGWFRAKPTAQASKLKSQNDAIQSQIDTLSQQQQQAVQERMKAEAADKRTKIEAQMLENTNKLNGYEAVEKKRRQALVAQGKSDDEIAADPVLDTIQKKKDEVGLTKSNIEQQHQIITSAGTAAQRAFMQDPASIDDVHTLDGMLKEREGSFTALQAQAQGLQTKLQNGAFTSNDERKAAQDQLQDVQGQLHHAAAQYNAVLQVRGAAVDSVQSNNGVVQPQQGKRDFNVDVDPNKFTLNFSADRIKTDPTTGTQLPASKESDFQQWKAKYAPQDTGGDYDLRGAYLAGIKPDADRGHFPDTYKLPNHPTFSDESMYSTPDHPGGHWDKDADGNDTFQPSAWMASDPKRMQQLQDYFKQNEPEAKLLPPPVSGTSATPTPSATPSPSPTPGGTTTPSPTTPPTQPTQTAQQPSQAPQSEVLNRLAFLSNQRESAWHSTTTPMAIKRFFNDDTTSQLADMALQSGDDAARQAAGNPENWDKMDDKTKRLSLENKLNYTSDSDQKKKIADSWYQKRFDEETKGLTDEQKSNLKSDSEKLQQLSVDSNKPGDVLSNGQVQLNNRVMTDPNKAQKAISDLQSNGVITEDQAKTAKYQYKQYFDQQAQQATQATLQSNHFQTFLKENPSIASKPQEEQLKEYNDKYGGFLPVAYEGLKGAIDAALGTYKEAGQGAKLELLAHSNFDTPQQQADAMVDLIQQGIQIEQKHQGEENQSLAAQKARSWGGSIGGLAPYIGNEVLAGLGSLLTRGRGAGVSEMAAHGGNMALMAGQAALSGYRDAVMEGVKKAGYKSYQDLEKADPKLANSIHQAGLKAMSQDVAISPAMMIPITKAFSPIAQRTALLRFAEKYAINPSVNVATMYGLGAAQSAIQQSALGGNSDFKTMSPEEALQSFVAMAIPSATFGHIQEYRNNNYVKNASSDLYANADNYDKNGGSQQFLDALQAHYGQVSTTQQEGISKQKQYGNDVQTAQRLNADLPEGSQPYTPEQIALARQINPTQAPDFIGLSERLKQSDDRVNAARKGLEESSKGKGGLQGVDYEARGKSLEELDNAIQQRNQILTDEIGKSKDAAQSSDLALKAAQEIHSMPDPADQAVATGIAKIANGQPVEHLTGEEKEALLQPQKSTDPTTGEETETPALIRMEKGIPVITDAATRWMEDKAPTAAQMIPLDETSQLRQIYPNEQPSEQQQPAGTPNRTTAPEGSSGTGEQPVGDAGSGQPGGNRGQVAQDGQVGASGTGGAYPQYQASRDRVQQRRDYNATRVSPATRSNVATEAERTLQGLQKVSSDIGTKIDIQRVGAKESGDGGVTLKWKSDGSVQLVYNPVRISDQVYKMGSSDNPITEGDASERINSTFSHEVSHLGWILSCKDKWDAMSPIEQESHGNFSSYVRNVTGAHFDDMHQSLRGMGDTPLARDLSKGIIGAWNMYFGGFGKKYIKNAEYTDEEGVQKSISDNDQFAVKNALAILDNLSQEKKPEDYKTAFNFMNEFTAYLAQIRVENITPESYGFFATLRKFYQAAMDGLRKVAMNTKAYHSGLDEMVTATADRLHSIQEMISGKNGGEDEKESKNTSSGGKDNQQNKTEPKKWYQNQEIEAWDKERERLYDEWQNLPIGSQERASAREKYNDHKDTQPKGQIVDLNNPVFAFNDGGSFGLQTASGESAKRATYTGDEVTNPNTGKTEKVIQLPDGTIGSVDSSNIPKPIHDILTKNQKKSKNVEPDENETPSQQQGDATNPAGQDQTSGGLNRQEVENPSGSVEKPTDAEQAQPKAELSEGEKALKDAFEGLMARKPASPEEDDRLKQDPYKASLPVEKMAAFMGAAQKLVSEGVKTPEQLSESLHKLGGEKLHKYSNAVWSLMRAFDQGLESEPQWHEHFGRIADREKNANTPEQAPETPKSTEIRRNPELTTPEQATKSQHPEPATPGNKPANTADFSGPNISNYERIRLPGKSAMDSAAIEVGQRPNGKWVSSPEYNTSVQGSASPFNHIQDKEYPSRDAAVQDSVNYIRGRMQSIYDSDMESAAHKKDAVKIWQFLNQHDPSGPKELKKTPLTDEQQRDIKHTQLIKNASQKALEAANEGKPFQVKDIIDNQGIAEIGGIKKAQEAIEAGIVDAAHEIATKYHQHESDEQDQQIDREKYDKLLKLYENQPTLGAQTSTSKINQAYSTPAPLAYVADKLCDLENGWGVYEPTGGHGMLLIDQRRPKETHFNELDENRVNNFQKTRLPSHATRVTSEDATTHSLEEPVDRVITNPPFGSVMDENGKPKVFQTPFGETTQIDHAIVAQALDQLISDEEAADKKATYAKSSDPNQRNRDFRGRATLIIGGPAKTITTPEGRAAYYGGGQRGAFFKYLYDNYGVVDHFTVNGDLYKKQGAGWPVDVITLVGTKPSEIALPSLKPPRMIDTWDDLWKTTQLTDEQRIAQNKLTESDIRQQAGDFLAGLPGLSGERGTPGQPEKPGERNSGQATTELHPSDSGLSGASGDIGQKRNTETTTGLVSGSDGNLEPGSGGNNRNLGTKGNQPSGESGIRPGDNTGIGNTEGRSQEIAKSQGDKLADATPQKAAGDEISDPSGSFQNKYTPKSKGTGLETLIPKNMEYPVREALDKLESEVGDIDEYVRKKLGYSENDPNYDGMSAEQRDAVALAVWNIERGQALINSDQTGVGKGRTVAGVMRYARENGFIPVFVTMKRSLHVDMLMRDLPDIGSDDFRPALLDGERKWQEARDKDLPYGQDYWQKVAQTGQLHEGADSIFTTYSQFMRDDAEGISKKAKERYLRDGQATPGGWRSEALKKLGKKVIYILDESHNAAGESNVGLRFRDLIDQGHSVYYLSATYAKRGENMPLYFKTALGRIAGGVDAIKELMQTGGTPVMQLVSSMLARAGQLIRREKDFSGAKFEVITPGTETEEQTLATKERDARLSDNLTSSLREIVTLQQRMNEAANAINQVVKDKAKSMNAKVGATLSSDNFASKFHNIVSQYLLSMKCAAGVDHGLKLLGEGKKVVFTLCNTMEGNMNDIVQRGFDSSYKGLVQKYCDDQRFFKVGKGDKAETIEITEHGAPEYNGVSDSVLKNMLVSKTGEYDPATLKPIVAIDQKVATELARRSMWKVFAEARDNINLYNFEKDMPLSPIDYLRQELAKAGYPAMEYTGRQTMMDENGQILKRPESETSDDGKNNIIKRFNNDKSKESQALILNESGFTGISLHAGRFFGDQRKRAMVILQAHPDINQFMQMLGRIHRSGQVDTPEFYMLTSTLPAEFRPAAINKKKMGMLNANTTSNAKSEVSEGNEIPDIFNKYGDEIVHQKLQTDPDLQRQLRALGGKMEKFFNDKEELYPYSDIQKNVLAGEPDGSLAKTVTGFLAVTPTEEQHYFWDRATSDYNAHIDYLNEIGQNDLEAKPLDMKAETLTKELLTPEGSGDTPFDGASYIEKVHAEIGKKPISGEEADQINRENNSKQREIMADFRSRSEKFKNDYEESRRKSMVSDWDTSKAREKFLKNMDEQQDQIAGAINKIGKYLTYKRSDGSNGMATIVDWKFDEESPMTPSKQIFTLRVNDTNHTIKISALHLKDFELSMFGNGSRWDQSSDNSSTRSIVTGNLVAAITHLGDTGQIITYTTKDGDIKTGIMLPDSYTQKADAEKKTPINTSNDFKNAFEGGFRIRNNDGSVNIRPDTLTNKNYLEVPASKASGGKYWQNQKLNSLMEGGEFRQVGNVMRGEIKRGREGDLYNQLSAMGENLQFIEQKSKGKQEPGLQARIPATPEEKMQAIRDKMAGRTQENSGKLSWDDEDLTHENTENGTEGESPTTLPRSLTAADLEQGGVGQAIPAERAYGEIAGKAAPEYAGVNSEEHVIHQDNKALVDWAKENNRFIAPDEASKFLEGKMNMGGTEHGSYKVTGSDGREYVVKVTKDGIYGFPGKSPFQYLRRMDDFSSEVPSSKVDFLGVSQDPETGKPAIWTIQPYVEGDHPSVHDLVPYLRKRGWVQGQDGWEYRDNQSGSTIQMRDAHEGNFIKTSDGKIVPIDVIFKGIGDKPTPVDEEGRNTLFARRPSTPGSTPEDRALRDEVESSMRDILDMQDQAKAQKTGERTIGNPKLALGAFDPQIMGVDEFRKTIATKQKEDQWFAEGKKLLSDDYEGTKQRIIDTGLSGGTLNPAETKAAQLMVARDLAAASTDKAKRADLAKLIYAYRQTGTEQARGLRSRRDPFQTPAERHREFIAKMIFSPSPAESKRIDKIENPKEKEEALTKAVDLQMEQAKKALESMGVSLDDILNGDVKVSLIGSKVSENILKTFKPNEQTALRLLQRGKTFENTAKATGMSVKQVQNLKQQFQDSFRNRHFMKFEKGMTAKDIEQAPGLQARKPVSPDQAEAEFSKALELMGMGEDAGLAKKKPNRTFNIEDPADAIKLGRAIASSGGNALNMVHEYWMASILSGMVTHAANFTGMGVNGAIDYTFQRGMEALVNSVIGNPEGTQMGEFKHIMKGVIPGVSNAVRAGLRAWDAEQSMIDYDLLGHDIKLDQGQIVGHASSGSIPGKTGRIIRMPLRALAFMDDACKTIIAHMEVGAQAYRLAKAQGLEGDEMAKFIHGEVTTTGSQSWERAVKHAVDLSFQTPLRTLDEGANWAEGLGHAIQHGLSRYTPGKFFIPFVRVMYNIPRVGFRKSPIGTVPMLYKMGLEGFYKIQDGKLNPHPYAGSEMIRDVSEQVLAWSLMAMLWGAAAGDPDDDKKKILLHGSNNAISKGERALNERLGIPPYHIRVNGTLYNYGRIEPIATVLGTTLDLISTAKAARDGASFNELSGMVLRSIMNQFTEKSFGKGLKDIAGVEQNPQTAADWAANFAASFVPNLIRQPIRATDNYVRETSIEGNPKDIPARMAQRIGQSAIPLGNLNEPRIDLYGDPIKKEGSILSRLTPMQGKEAPKVEIADKLFSSWNAKHPDEKFSPDKPARRYVDPITGKVNYMDDKMFRKYSEIAGKSFKMATRAAITPAMAKNPTEEDHKLVKKILEQSRKEAKQQVLATMRPKSRSIAEMLFSK